MPTQPLRLLAVENEPGHALALRLLLAEQGYELVGLASSAAEARRLFDALVPDMLLLDINLSEPGDADPTDGIALAIELTSRRPVPLIFLTSFPTTETFARARQAGPFAFLSKPYDAALINFSIELAVQHFAQVHAQSPTPLAAGTAGPPDLLAMNGTFFVREKGHLCRLPLTEVLRVEADDSHVHFHTTTRKYTVRSSLREVQERLPANQFLQVHRSWLVRLAAIEEINYSDGELVIGGQRVPLARSGREELRRRLTNQSL